MQKQLITDQLIDITEKEIIKLGKKKKNASSLEKKEYFSSLIHSCNFFLGKMQSLRQQEAQNVIDAANDFKYPSGQDYFTQTFKQQKGEVLK